MNDKHGHKVDLDRENSWYKKAQKLLLNKKIIDVKWCNWDDEDYSTTGLVFTTNNDVSFFLLKKINRKSMLIRESGRSSDYITPSFGFGCLFKCSYCYMRRHVKNGLSVATNTDDILNAITEHANSLQYPKTPNQTHNSYYTYDFSCNEDFILHAKFHDWVKIFEYFMLDDRIMGTAATKYVNDDLLTFNPNKKIRIRFSLMPQEISDKLEPGTSKIIDRIKAINEFMAAGYDVHINYSPIIVYDNSKQAYAELFDLVNKHVHDSYKEQVTRCTSIT